MDPDETHEEVRHQEAVLCELWCKSLCLCVCVCVIRIGIVNCKVPLFHGSREPILHAAACL